MARKPILQMARPDDSGEVYPLPIDQEITMTNAKKSPGYVFDAPSQDIGIYGSFHVPANYSSTPKIRVTGILDGAIAASAVLAFGVQVNYLADNETVDAAYETAELWEQDIDAASYADEDVVIMLSDALPAGIAAGDWVPYFFFRDDSQDTYTGKFILTGLEFDYTTT